MGGDGHFINLSEALFKVAEASLIRRIDGSSGISVTKDPTCDQLVISKSNGDPLILAN